MAALSREVYAEQLYRRSLAVIEAVHDFGPEDVQRAVDLALADEAPAGVDPAVALAVVLAAQVDPGSKARDRLGWLVGGLQQRVVSINTQDRTEIRLNRQLEDVAA
jgi:hypothetical protein